MALHPKYPSIIGWDIGKTPFDKPAKNSTIKFNHGPGITSETPDTEDALASVISSHSVMENSPMSLSATRTLNEDRARPACIFRSTADLNCSELSKRLAWYDENAPLKHQPENDAVNFYLLNHAMHEVSTRVDGNQSLGVYQPIADAYHLTIAECGLRMLYYLICITTREARHVRSKIKSIPDKLHPKGVHPIHAQWILDLPSDEEKAPKQFKKSPPPMSIGKYADMLYEVFMLPGWGGSYGGEKWAKITDAWRKLAYGQISFEMLLDMGFALAHNGGPIFNKGIYYKHYDHSTLVRILNVQRAGQMPQFVCSGGYAVKFNPSSSVIEKDYAMCRDILGDCFTGTVDEEAIKAAGAVEWNGLVSKKNPFVSKIEEEFAAVAVETKSASDANSYTIMPGNDGPIWLEIDK